MALSATKGEAFTPLSTVLRRAGAVFSARDGYPVAIHYGSAAGELSVCARAVGLVDRSELAKLLIEAPPAQLADLMARVADGAVLPGGILSAGGAWWCGLVPGRVLVLCRPALGGRLRARLADQVQRRFTMSVTDLSLEWAGIELLGPKTSDVLRALGVYGRAGDPRRIAPFSAGTVAGFDARWLLPSDHRALALVRSGPAGEAWRAIEDAGRPLGLSCVGREAASRYAVLNRAAGVPYA